MTAAQWKTGREEADMTQVAAAHLLAVSQPYLSQLEAGARVGSSDLTRRAMKVYKVRLTALPLPDSMDVPSATPNDLQENLASLGYPGFQHYRAEKMSNPAEVVLSAVLHKNLDTRLVEALPWVLGEYTDIDWRWLRDRAKLNNAQNRLGYLVHLAEQTSRVLPEHRSAVPVLSQWESELEDARLAQEGTLCRDSMPEPERKWLRDNRPPAAAHWSLLTSMTAEQLPYVER
jgi:transcriptional regulator with XRE-family HTH domain